MNSEEIVEKISAWHMLSTANLERTSHADALARQSRTCLRLANAMDALTAPNIRVL